MKKIAVINDISGFGKCSLTAAIPIISAHKMQCCPLPTGVFSNQTGYDSYKSVDLTSSLIAFIREWEKLGAEFDAIITGFLPNVRQGEIILSFLEKFKKENTLLAVDPIMGDDGEIYDTYDIDKINAVKTLVKKADLITPNVTELALLCERDIKADYSLTEIQSMVKTLDVPLAVVTGIDLENEIGNLVYDRNEFRLIKSKKIGKHFSGTGDIFVAYAVSECLCGRDIFSAAENASRFIERSIALTLKNTEELDYHADGIDFEALLKTE